MSGHDQRAHEALTGLDAGDPAHRDAMTVPVPADPLAAAERRGYLRGLEDAARMVDCGCDGRATVLAELHSNSAARWHACGRDPCGALDAAAIRDLAKESPR